MEEELNYLSDKIKYLTELIEECTKVIETKTCTEAIYYYASVKKPAEIEKQLLENILNKLTI